MPLPMPSTRARRLLRALRTARRTHGVVTAADGAALAVTTCGDEHAPGERRVAVVVGAHLSAWYYRPFAHVLRSRLRELSGQDWAVDVYDRRGRGDSDAQPRDYSMDTEVTDLAAVLEHTGARNLIGHSLGGSVVLNALQQEGELFPAELVPDRTALYDPCVNLDGPRTARWMARLEQAVADGRTARGLAILQRGLESSAVLARVPEWFLTFTFAGLVATPLGRMARRMLPTLSRELTAALHEDDRPEDFAGIASPVHLMCGSLSPQYFQEVVRRLHAAMPSSTFECSPRCMHGAIPFVLEAVLSDLAEHFTAARPADTVAEATDDSQHEAGPAAEASGEAGPAAETPAPTVSAARTPVPAA